MPGGDAGGAGDVGDLRLEEAVAGEDLRGGLEDGVALVGDGRGRDGGDVCGAVAWHMNERSFILLRSKARSSTSVPEAVVALRAALPYLEILSDRGKEGLGDARSPLRSGAGRRRQCSA